MLLLQINEFSKTYSGNKKAVDHLSLQIEEGDIYGFIGHNGAGKSTTLKAVVGILPFEEGEILIGGKSIRSHPVECKKRMAYIPDNPDIYPHMTGIGYLNFICDLYHVDKKLRNERIDRYSELLEIRDHLGDTIGSYSHGMKQKIAIISALAHEPDLLILDEPFVGLDPKATHTLKNMMKEYVKRGHAIFFSSHVLEVVEKLCNKVAIIREGILIASGPIDDVKGDESLENIFLELTEHE